MLRKHEEEVVLVKSEQKRKITGLQDVINRLRQRVAECHRNIEKDEGTMQTQNADLRQVQVRHDHNFGEKVSRNLKCE